jgi:hypothetical protein
LTEAPRVVVVSPVAPVPAGVGGVFLRDLCLMYPAERLSFAILPGIGDDRQWPAPLEAAPRVMLDVVPERGFNRWGRRVQTSTRGAFDRYVQLKHLPRLVDRVIEFAERTKPEIMWVPLAGPTMINIAAELREEVGIPMITTVWDPPDYALSHYWGLRGRSLDRVLDNFGDAIRASERCGVASQEMKEHYESQYGTPCVPMIHGMPASEWLAPTGMRSPSEPFVIGYAGSLYARDEWDALMHALGESGWRIGGRPVVIRVLSTAVDLRATGPARVEFLGWHSTTDAMRVLAECDVCYVPYWFGAEFRSAVELSFPNKVSLYLASGRPIFFHGPRKSTPASFLERWPVGVTAHTLESNEILRALTTAALDADFHAAAAESIPRVLRAALGLHVFRERFAELLGVDQAVLAPVSA